MVSEDDVDQWAEQIYQLNRHVSGLGINCKAGKNRSALVAAILLICYYWREIKAGALSIKQVLLFICQQRPICEIVPSPEYGGRTDPKDLNCVGQSLQSRRNQWHASGVIATCDPVRR